jgi:hypothetical protein
VTIDAAEVEERLKGEGAMTMEGDVEEHSGYLDEVSVPYGGREYVLMTLQKYLTKSCWVLICVAC